MRIRKTAEALELNSNPSLEKAADRAEPVPTAARLRRGGGSPGALPPLSLTNGAAEMHWREQGKPLEASWRGEQESRFGWDLGSVRIHTGPSAERSASSLHTRAYTLGLHMIFGHGEYNPGSPSGRALLAHELTHVIQQGSGAAPFAFQRKEPDIPTAETDVTGTAASPTGSGGLGPVMELPGGTGIQLITTATPLEERIPAWLPSDLRGEILRGEIAAGVSRQPGLPPWGDIVIWVSSDSAFQSVEIYQEFPSDEVFYATVAQGDTYVANLLLDVYSAYNREMAYFVEQKGLSPGSARNELRRINDEVFRLVIVASLITLISGPSVGVFANQRSVVDAAERTRFARRQTEKVPLARIKEGIVPVEGRVNVGGVDETPSGWTNLNPNLTSKQDLSGVNNLVVGKAEDIGEIFVAGSIREMSSSKLPSGVIDLGEFASGAYQAMAPGGTFRLNFLGSRAYMEEVGAAFTNAGFKNVGIDEFGVIVQGVK